MKTLIIAEAGVNHNGSVELAKRLIDVAVAAGVDIVKFQTFKTEKVISKIAPRAEYQDQNTGNTESQFEMVRKLELSNAELNEVIDYCAKQEIKFLSTPFDHDSIELLNQIGMDIFKVPSGEITNLPYLRHVGSLKKKILISTGMANLGEIEGALGILEEAGMLSKDITILHCNTEYPTPFSDVNLKAMQVIKDAFGVNVGYSDHTRGIEVPIAAVALGATVIEKHFTLDRNMSGPDHKASLEPDELRAMVLAIRNIELAIGDGFKKPSPSEKKNIAIARRSIHLAHDLPTGHILDEKDLLMIRPGDGISPMRMPEILGSRLRMDLPAFHKLDFVDIQYVNH